MTYLEVVNTIMVRLGNRPVLKPRIETELKYAKEFVMEKDPGLKPWFLLTDALQTVAMVTDQPFVNLPTNFLAEYEDGFAWLTDEVTEIHKDTYNIRVARERSSGADGETGTIPGGAFPTHYSIVGKRMYLFPTPNADSTNVKLRYYASTLDLRDDATNIWLTEGADWLINEAGARVAQDIQSHDQWKVFQASAIRSRQRILAETEERAAANHDGIPE